MGQGLWLERKAPFGHSGGGEGRERKSCTVALRERKEVRLRSRRRRTAMGRGLWLERKDLVGHSGSGCQKKWAAGRGRVAFWEGQGSQAAVREGEDFDDLGIVVGEEGSGWP